MDASDAIIGSAVVITGTTIAREQINKDSNSSPLKVIFFGFLLASALLTLSLGAPTFAKGLAMLGLVGAFVVNGPVIFSWMAKL